MADFDERSEEYCLTQAIFSILKGYLLPILFYSLRTTLYKTLYS